MCLSTVSGRQRTLRATRKELLPTDVAATTADSLGARLGFACTREGRPPAARPRRRDRADRVHERCECTREDSNLHTLRYRNLNPARLPVPPLVRGGARLNRPHPPGQARPQYQDFPHIPSGGAERQPTSPAGPPAACPVRPLQKALRAPLERHAAGVAALFQGGTHGFGSGRKRWEGGERIRPAKLTYVRRAGRVTARVS